MNFLPWLICNSSKTTQKFSLVSYIKGHLTYHKVPTRDLCKALIKLHKTSLATRLHKTLRC